MPAADRRQSPPAAPESGAISYFRCAVEADSAARLASFARAHGVPNPTPAERLHCTLLYSPTPVSAAPAAAEGLYPCAATPTGWAVWDFPGKGRHLVLLLAAPPLEARHRALLSAGGTHKFGPYQPHVTVSKDVGDSFRPENLPPLTDPIVIAAERLVTRVPDHRSRRAGGAA
jgi:hypothetical protein